MPWLDRDFLHRVTHPPRSDCEQVTVNETPSLSIDLNLPLDPFTLQFRSGMLNGQITGLFGPSGSGKTSLVETIAGLRRNAKGRITFGETVWMDSDQNIFLPPEQRGIGFVPQRGLLFPHLSVRKNLLFGAKRSTPKAGRNPAPNRDLFDQVIDILNLEGITRSETLTRFRGAKDSASQQRVPFAPIHNC